MLTILGISAFDFSNFYFWDTDFFFLSFFQDETIFRLLVKFSYLIFFLLLIFFRVTLGRKKKN